MNTDLIKKKLQTFNKNTETRPDNRNFFWSPPIGESTVRIVPDKDNEDIPFTELDFHSRKVDKYARLALTNFGEKDPIVDYIEKLKSQKGPDGKIPSESWSIIGKLKPRPRYLCKVIVRGEEDLGVRLWTLNETNYKRLLQWAARPDVGDYTDVMEGRDIVVNRVKIMRGDRESTETTVDIAMSTSPLSKDNSKVKLWLTDQPVPLLSYRKCDYSYLQGKLEEWLQPTHPDSADNSDSGLLTKSNLTEGTSKEVTFTDSTTYGKPKKKSSKLEEFDKNFNDLTSAIASKEDEIETTAGSFLDEDDDDLPF